MVRIISESWYIYSRDLNLGFGQNPGDRCPLILEYIAITLIVFIASIHGLALAWIGIAMVHFCFKSVGKYSSPNMTIPTGSVVFQLPCIVLYFSKSSTNFISGWIQPSRKKVPISCFVAGVVNPAPASGFRVTQIGPTNKTLISIFGNTEPSQLALHSLVCPEQNS